MPDTVAREAHIHGVVQGVSYRYATVREAERLGVHGFVRNQPDGTVFLHAEGPAAAVEALITWCHQGPPHAHVTHIDQQPTPPTGATEFQIR